MARLLGGRCPGRAPNREAGPLRSPPMVGSAPGVCHAPHAELSVETAGNDWSTFISLAKTVGVQGLYLAEAEASVELSGPVGFPANLQRRGARVGQAV